VRRALRRAWRVRVRLDQILLLYLLELRVDLVGELSDACVGRQDVARGRDVLRRPHLVARQHPHLDTRQPEVGEHLGHAVLELVLDRGGALEGELPL
jgi:hypothetical protein